MGESIMFECWLPISRAQNYYEVSDLGRVRSLSRVVPFGRSYRRVPSIILTPAVDKYGRQIVGLSVGGVVHQCFVHRLVLTAFVGACPDGMEGYHWDGNASNNNLYNLRWDTHISNEADKIRHGNNDRSRRMHCPRNHKLLLPNLVPSMLDKGRSCLACDRASTAVRTAKQRGLLLDFRILADCNYALIMSGKAPVIKAGPRFDENQVRAVQARYRAGGIRQADLAREYGTSQPVIGRMVRGEYVPRRLDNNKLLGASPR